MKLLQALEILKRPVTQPNASQEISLLCGFTPLHLQTFLSAHLRIAFPKDIIEMKAGLYGDLLGNIERLSPVSRGIACVVIEWSDLDPRLGIRSLGSWRTSDINDIVESARRRSDRLAHLIKNAAELMPVYVSTPTLPLPPLFVTTPMEAQCEEWTLREIAAGLAASVSTSRHVKVVNPQELDEVSPLCHRFNIESELVSGFPYNLDHANSLAEAFVTLIKNTSPRKGLITDLDDTLWGGILGEVGVEGISWDLASRTHIHGLYQRLLDSLASAGVLLAATSKNDRQLVEHALQREDILVSKDKIFPIEAHWGAKSQSVERILKCWNIAPDDVIFVDDNPMEVAEVKSSFAQMECVIFPKDDYRAAWELLKHLRNCFGKTVVSAEDEIRLNSIRSAATVLDANQSFGPAAESFLRGADATIEFSFKPDPHDTRAFELINKTNQFNLNGKRVADAEWLQCLQQPGAFLATATYKDKYGPLGKIAVIMGKNCGSTLQVRSWVMSCRAFSRRIEHHCLKYLFDKTNAETIIFDYVPTTRNGPIRDFFLGILSEEPASPMFSLSRATFEANSPAVFHRIVEVGDN